MSEMKLTSGKYAIFMNYILQGANFLFPLITYPYVTRVLGAKSLGTVSFANSIANYFSAIATFGLTTYAIRTSARVRNDKHELSRTVGELFTANGATTLLAVVLYALVIMLFPRFREQWILMLLFGISFMSDFLGVGWIYTALEKYTYITVRTLIFKVITFFALLLLIHNTDDGIVYAAILAGSNVCTNIVNYLYAQKMVRFRVQRGISFVGHYRYTKWFFIQSVALTLFSNMDITMLGFLGDQVQTGNYEAAVKIKTLLSALVSSLGNLFLPRLSQFIKEEKMDAYWRTIHKSLSYNSFISIPLIGFFLLESNEVIALLCGGKYLYAGDMMKILVFTVYIIGISTVTGIQILLSMNKERNLLFSSVGGTAVNILLNWLLIPKLFGVGAAIATVLAEIAVLFLQIMFLYRMNIKVPILRLSVKAFVGTVFAVAAAFILQGWIPMNGLLEIIVTAIVFAVVYLTMLLVLKEEIASDLVHMVLHRRKK